MLQNIVRSFWEPCWGSAPWHFRVPAHPPQPCFPFHQLHRAKRMLSSGGIVQVNNVNDYGNNYGSGSWNKKHFNNNCYYQYGGCYNKHRINTVAMTVSIEQSLLSPQSLQRSNLFLPLIIGGGFGAYDYYDYNDGYDDYYGYARVSNKHVRWCLNRYRSYNPRTNLWTAYSGRKHQCDSPYY